MLVWNLQEKPIMKPLGIVLALALASLPLAAQKAPANAPPPTALKVGDIAPDFTLPAIDGSRVTLSSFKGKKTVVLAFFPAAFTGGWTKELTAYQSGIGKFKDVDVQVLAISGDFIATLNHWAKELNAEFPMLSDYKREVMKEYGVLGANYLANRTTFVIDQTGKIVSIEEGSSAIDPTGAVTACSRLKH
jgi:peroxiredoxin Q/BCP